MRNIEHDGVSRGGIRCATLGGRGSLLGKHVVGGIGVHECVGAMADHLKVVAAAILGRDDKVLIAKRADHLHQGGKWEFPGGKIEPNESNEDALCRELNEELGIRPTSFEPLISIRHEYPERRVLLDVWRVTCFWGEPSAREGQVLAWVDRSELHHYTFPEANYPILKALSLPENYLITPEPNSEWSAFANHLETVLKRGQKLIQLRAKRLASDDYLALAKQVQRLCARYGARLIINGEPEWAKRLTAHGVQLGGGRLMQYRTRPLSERYLIGASCHNRSELAWANELGADFAVLSPVKETRTHPDSRPMGWEKFQKLCATSNIPVYALGGMVPEDLAKARRCGAQGIAAIRSLWPVI